MFKTVFGTSNSNCCGLFFVIHLWFSIKTGILDSDIRLTLSFSGVTTTFNTIAEAPEYGKKAVETTKKLLSNKWTPAAYQLQGKWGEKNCTIWNKSRKNTDFYIKSGLDWENNDCPLPPPPFPPITLPSSSLPVGYIIAGPSWLHHSWPQLVTS